MKEMIERVAKAIYLHETGFSEDDWAMYNPATFYATAAVAIMAMRDPTNDMCLAAFQSDKRLKSGPAKHWRAMIDAALASDVALERWLDVDKLRNHG